MIAAFHRTRRAKAALALAAAALLLGGVAAPARAGSAFHLRLVRSDPAADATVPPPAALRLTFSEAPELAVTSVRLRDATDHAVALRPLARAQGDRATLVATPRAALAHGRYTVTWRTMSHDGHAMHGTYHFTVAAAGHDHH